MSSSTTQDPFAWLDGVAVAATVCDRLGVCIYLNAQAAKVFAASGGRALVGKNLLDCHDEPARSRFAAQLASPAPSTYTIEYRRRAKARSLHALNRQPLTRLAARGDLSPLRGARCFQARRMACASSSTRFPGSLRRCLPAWSS